MLAVCVACLVLGTSLAHALLAPTRLWPFHLPPANLCSKLLTYGKSLRQALVLRQCLTIACLDCRMRWRCSYVGSCCSWTSPPNMADPQGPRGANGLLLVRSACSSTEASVHRLLAWYNVASCGWKHPDAACCMPCCWLSWCRI